MSTGERMCSNIVIAMRVRLGGLYILLVYTESEQCAPAYVANDK